MKLSRDGWTGLAALAASLVFFWLTLELKPNPLVPVGPGFYPRIVLGLTALLAFALIVFDLIGGARKAASRENLNYGLVLAVFAIFGLYIGALPYLGFRIATLVFVAALQATLEPPRGMRGWAVAGVTAFATTVASYFLFERYLQVLLPRGRWTDF
ncbi:MAG: tripartite tricarboxylate transporter TctB family protein [Betaproteobacteria bacterium]